MVNCTRCGLRFEISKFRQRSKHPYQADGTGKPVHADDRRCQIAQSVIWSEEALVSSTRSFRPRKDILDNSTNRCRRTQDYGFCGGW